MCDLKAPTDTDLKKPDRWQAINSGMESKTIQALALSPKSSDVVYAGSIAGVYKTDNGGKQWTAVNAGLTSKDVKTLVVYPKDSQVLYCGTWGHGVFHSNDGGLSWTLLSTSNIEPHIDALAVSDNNTDYIWAATNEGLFRSKDGGGSWLHSYHSGKVLSVAVRPGDIKTVYIGARYQGCMKSVDGGQTWCNINIGLFKSGSLYASPNSIVFDPQNSEHIFASTGWVDIYVTENGGSTWRHIGHEVEEKKVQALAINPGNPKKLWAATESDGVWRSVDAGKSWSEFNVGLATLNTRCIVAGIRGVVYVGTVGEGIFKYVDSE